MCKCENHKEQTTLSKAIVNYIEECKTKEHSDSYLIAILHKIQEEYGFLSREHMTEVAERLNVPTSVVSGISTFYHLFRLKPRGKNAISVCMGTACFVKGAQDVVDHFKKHLGIELGEVTPDGMFSLEICRCLGVCAMAPVVMINDKIYSNVKSTDIPQIIRNIKMEKVAKA